MERGADPLIGRLLDGRYSLVRRIARGGMATVYEAQDLRLQRVCAVKVMHTDLGDDQDFGARFVLEAHAAARLSHPNVVSVTDQGDDDGVLFLVMEHVPGRTLRDVISEEAPLTPRRALALLEPVLAALGEAHRSGLVHRDVKPENVLIADDGRVKVADFGLARAFDNTATNTATGGILIGTVSYLAPELIVNQRADPRADVYAAGVVLYELLTGRKPHQGEGPIQIAYKHVNEDVPPPSRAGSGQPIPAYVDALVVRATARDRDKRQADAKVFLQQVRRVRAALEAGETDDPELTADLLPTVTLPVPDSIDYVDEGSAAAVHAREEEDTSVVPVGSWVPAGAPPPGQTHNPVMTAPRVLMPAPPHQRVHPPPVRPAPAGAHPARPTRTRGSRRGPLLLLLVVLLTALVAYSAWWLGMGRYTSTPGIINQGVAAAQDKLTSAGLKLDVSRREFSETVTAGSVISTDPAAGARIADGGTVHAVVSKGRERYAVPTVRGRDLTEAEQMLTAAHLTLGDVHAQWHDKLREGVVITASPVGGTELRLDTPVDLVVSRGPEPIEIPDFSGRNAERAVQRLTDLGFEPKVSEEHSDAVDKGAVISQDPTSGTGHRGDRIELKVSLGPVMVEVPQLEALSVDEATRALEDVGLKIAVDRTDLYIGLNRVVKQDPKAGESIARGSVVAVSVV